MSHESHPLSETLRNELEQLLMLATHGDACEMELERLNSLLRTHEELRRHAARFLRDEALLREELRVLCASELLGPEAASTSALGMLPDSQRDRSGPRTRFLHNLRQSLTNRILQVGLAACAVAVVLLMVFLFSRTMDNKTLPGSLQDLAGQPLVESTDDGVAVLTQAVAVEWGQGTKPKIGDTIPPSVLRLKSGLAQIEFYSSASVLLEGPAELELISADQCFCRNGKMRVAVPRAAQGFTVLSPEIEVVDLGTDFGVEVTPLVQTQVHVFDGKVELYPPDSKRELKNRIELLAGSGQQIERSGESFAIATNAKAFVSMKELKRRVDEDVFQRATLWRPYKRDMNQDPRLVAFYAFEHDEEDARTLPSHETLDRSLDGAIVGCEWSEGRWPGKDALEFKRPGDCVRIHVPGEYDALTLAAWVRVDGLDRNLSSLMLTDGWDMGEIHWQIKHPGKLRLGIRTTVESRKSHDYDSPEIWGLKQLGQWTHLVPVIENQAGYVTHYANGRELSREPLVKPIKLRIGDAEIGNWKGPILENGKAMPNVDQIIRNFNGRIDEFIIMGQSLKLCLSGEGTWNVATWID